MRIFEERQCRKVGCSLLVQNLIKLSARFRGDQQVRREKISVFAAIACSAMQTSIVYPLFHVKINSQTSTERVLHSYL